MKRIPKLQLIEFIDAEVAHHYEPSRGDLILSKANKFFGHLAGRDFEFSVPTSGGHWLLSQTRLSRRALRLDKCNAIPNRKRDGIVALYFGGIYFYDLDQRKLHLAERLRQCRNVLHCAIAVEDHGIYFGEYGNNPNREPVPIWKSSDDGRTWAIVYEFPAKTIRHVHGVYVDPYSNSLWIPTGDFEGECFVYEVRDASFDDVRAHGNGRQQWRPVSMFFEPDRIVWPMDSQLEVSHLEVFDRKTGTLEQHSPFSGPVCEAVC